MRWAPKGDHQGQPDIGIAQINATLPGPAQPVADRVGVDVQRLSRRRDVTGVKKRAGRFDQPGVVGLVVRDQAVQRDG